MMKKYYLIFKLAFLLLLSVALSLHVSHAQFGSSISLKGQETLTIETNQIITGNITLQEDSVLTIKNATVIVNDPQATRTLIHIQDNAKLILENAILWPSLLRPHDLEIFASGNSKIEITNSTFINAITLIGNSSVIGNNAKIYSSTGPFSIPETDSAFGVVQLSQNAMATFTNSAVGSFALDFSSNDQAILSNLRSRLYEDFDLKRDLKLQSGFNIVLANTSILPVQIEGAFERGWSVFADPNTKLQINDSSLNKFVFKEFKNETLTFNNLKVDTSQAFDFRDIHLINTVIENQWGFWGEDSNITVENSEGIWLWPIGTGTWKLIQSRMNELDPRRFVGTLIFDNSIWANTGEIFENTDMKIEGTAKFTEKLDLFFADSMVTREYPIEVVSKKKKSIRSFSVDVFDGSEKIAHTETKEKTALIPLSFTQENYKKNFQLNLKVGKKIKKTQVGFFTNTPIVVRY